MAADAVEQLLAINALHELKARYCRFVDTKQWDRLRALFAPGARVEGFGSVADGSDAATFVDGIGARLASAVTLHRVSSPELSFDAPDTARCLWAMMDYVDFASDAAGDATPGARGWIGWGYYEDTYQRVDGAWTIAHMRLTRQSMNDLDAAHPLPQPGRIPPSLDWI